MHLAAVTFVVLTVMPMPAKAGGWKEALTILGARPSYSHLEMRLMLELDNPTWHVDCNSLIIELVAPTQSDGFLALSDQKSRMTSVALKNYYTQGYFRKGKILDVAFMGDPPGFYRVSRCHYISESFSVGPDVDYADLLIRGQIEVK